MPVFLRRKITRKIPIVEPTGTFEPRGI